MESLKQLKKQALKEKRLKDRLHLGTTRVKDAERERIWAIALAHSEGLSIRKIAEATGLSSSRVHQLLRPKHRVLGLRGNLFLKPLLRKDFSDQLFRMY